MGVIDVGGSHYPTVDMLLVGQVDVAWARFLEELKEAPSEHGKSNNELKERINLVWACVQRLQREVASLPPQGRTIHFKGTANASAESILRAMERRV